MINNASILSKIFMLVCCLFMLAACGSGGRSSPDEFSVMNRAPLTIPPESTLRPPRPGEPRAQEIDPGRIAFEALFPGKKLRPREPLSKSEMSVISRVGGSESGIRANTGKDNVEVVKKVLLLSDILTIDDRVFRPDNIEITRLSTNSLTKDTPSSENAVRK